jgi:hypothetical protein
METEKKSFDISKLRAVEEADMEVVDADGNGTGWVWTFAGPGHPITVEADRRQAQRFLDRETEKERSQVNGRKWKGEAPKFDERRADGIAYVVARLLRWTDQTLNDEPYPCTAENAKALLLDPNMGLLYEQANAFLMADKSFSRRSAKT